MRIFSTLAKMVFISQFVLFANLLLPQTSMATTPPPAPDRTYVIYMVLWDGSTDVEKGFKEYLAQQGIKAEYVVSDCKGNAKKCHELVADIKQVKPDLVFTWSTPAVKEIAGSVNAKNKDEYVWTIPIVSTLAASPVKSEIIYDMNKPGRNVTGVNHIAPMEAQVNTMLSYVPLKKMGVFFTTVEPISTPMVDAFHKECEKRGIESVSFPYSHLINGKLDVSKLDETFKRIKEAGVDLIYLPPSNIMSGNGKELCEIATRNKLMTFTGTELMVAKGPPLMALISSNINIGRMAGQKAEDILVKKQDIAQIPYQTFDKFAFVIAKSVMRQIKVYPPLITIDSASFIADKDEEKTAKDAEPSDKTKSA